MPFKSESQRRFLWENHPDIAKRWTEEYPNQGKLPRRLHLKSRSYRPSSVKAVFTKFYGG